MQDSNIQTLFLLGLLIGLLQALLLLWIIRSANETKRRDDIQLQNQKLLALLAEQMGVDVNKINEVV